jgi:hypothetical protein
MHSQGRLGNLGEPTVSLPQWPEDQGYRLTKSPGAEEVASAYQRVRLRRRHKREGAGKVSGDERAAKDLSEQRRTSRGAVGSLSGA